MRKVFSFVALTVACTAHASSEHIDFFVGGGIGYHLISINDLESNDNYTPDYMAFHLRTGLYVNENHRFTLTTNVTGDNEVYARSLALGGEALEVNQSEFLLSYDYLHPVTQKLSLFGGVTAGAIRNKLLQSDSSWLSSWQYSNTSTDFSFGGQAGIQFALSSEASVDLTYRYMGSSFDDELVGFEFNDHSELSLSIDYRF
ncbi:outer membrane beta-barrel protein [Vibrio mexicanus]|uniref:outer membrane beta-barrel protein n=1 Tax=Vibrio mexicanus TaxID=1004326 RepID=UPI00063CAE12|nr:outer membrane beta-barrel protein [Vibrio mexicanus]